MTEKITGKHGVESEDKTEEIFNQTFFRDFTFRSPRKDDKNKKEITDALIAFDDVLLIVQVKSQKTDREPSLWIQSNLTKAINQLSGAINYIKSKRKIEIKDSRRGQFEINFEDYRLIYGLIIIDQSDSTRIDVSSYTDEFYKKHKHAIQIISLKDFNKVCQIFDTAEEVLHYYDMRQMFLTANNILLHDEQYFLSIAVNHFSELSKQYRQFINSPKIEGENIHLFDQEEYYKSRMAGLESEEYIYSKIIDDIIDHCHKFDEALYDSISSERARSIINPGQYFMIAHELAKTGRRTRIKHGKSIMSRVSEARTCGFRKDLFISISSKLRSTAYLYYIPKIGTSREEIMIMVAGRAMKYIQKHPEFNIVISIGIEFDGKGNVRYQYSMIKNCN